MDEYTVGLIGLRNVKGEVCPQTLAKLMRGSRSALPLLVGTAMRPASSWAKTFTGHVTGNLVLAAIAVAAHECRAALGHLSAIVTLLMGIFVRALIVPPRKAWSSWPLLPTIMGMEVILIVVASFALASGVAHGIEIFVIFVSLALGLQNGAFRRVGGISVHTTYLTGMMTSLISAEAEKHASEVVSP